MLLLCHDDAPTYSKYPLWDLVESYGVTVFGCSAAFLQFTHDRLLPKQAVQTPQTCEKFCILDLKLSPDSAATIAQSLKLTPEGICGGTDICGVFRPQPGVALESAHMAGVLGMAIDGRFQGQSIFEESGDLICTASFPGMPLGLLGDNETQDRYRQTYFSHPEFGDVSYWFSW